ncbi:MAG: acetyl/propionyl-CoA carboxylase subunit alpha, partial [Rhizobiales bacterium]|nr:acetyl/propionyl-CoA carboxylase subunit alpha [Hyphomicrobiales bacterium]
LGERECSIQRRNQKVVEEAPSSAVDEKLRASMGGQAVALARAVGYVSAGTVEFITDGDGGFYFLEMNTRLQVEHTVTELITGLDLVEEMIRIAAGEKISVAQKDVSFNGWAIETRVYAEDPARNFLPSIGRLIRYNPPREGTSDGLTIRNDTGVEEGGAITVHYDPLISKLCTHAPTRDEASAHMGRALDRFTIVGIEHNIAFLTALMEHPRWREGRLSTHFIDEEYPDGFSQSEADPEVSRQLIALAAIADHLSQRRTINGAGSGRGESEGAFTRQRIIRAGGDMHALTVEASGDELTVGIGAKRIVAATDWHPGELLIEATLDGKAFAAQIRPHSGGMLISRGGVTLDTRVMSPREADLMARMPEKAPPDTSRQLLCPMPGTVISLAVTEGQTVKPGEALCVVEAMKMENILRAERDATIARILAHPGDSLAVDAIIMEFE